MSFEETEDELYKDVASLNLDLQGLVARKKIVLEYVLLERRDILEKGEFNLEGLFVRLEHAIDSIWRQTPGVRFYRIALRRCSDNQGVLRLEIKVTLSMAQRQNK